MDELAERALTTPHPDRLPLDIIGRGAILAAHERAMAADDAGYLDPSTGLFVLTAATHAQRGSCCERGCRHCPYLR